jgi:hypothetical protein
MRHRPLAVGESLHRLEAGERRDPGEAVLDFDRAVASQEAASLASPWAEPKYSAVLIFAARASSSEAKAMMFWFPSMVKVFIAIPFIALFATKAK